MGRPATQSPVIRRRPDRLHPFGVFDFGISIQVISHSFNITLSHPILQVPRLITTTTIISNHHCQNEGYPRPCCSCGPDFGSTQGQLDHQPGSSSNSGKLKCHFAPSVDHLSACAIQQWHYHDVDQQQYVLFLLFLPLAGRARLLIFVLTPVIDVITTTTVVDYFITVCPSPTVITYNHVTYTASYYGVSILRTPPPFSIYYTWEERE